MSTKKLFLIIIAIITAGLLLGFIAVAVGLLLGWKIGLLVWLILMFTNIWSTLKKYGGKV